MRYDQDAKLIYIGKKHINLASKFNINKNKQICPVISSMFEILLEVPNFIITSRNMMSSIKPSWRPASNDSVSVTAPALKNAILAPPNLDHLPLLNDLLPHRNRGPDPKITGEVTLMHL